MKKQTAPSTKAYLIRGASYLLLLVGLSAIPFALGSWQAHAQRTLTFAQRVAYQRAIEDVYWRHRIWPKERPDAKPPLDAVMSQAQLEKKVADYLRKSQALEDYWHRPITAEQLQAEMDRMAQHTKQPEVLRELFEALGNDPFLIAECLARPALAERLLTSWYTYDQTLHEKLKLSKNNDHLKFAAVSWPKEPLESWLTTAETHVRNTIAERIASYRLRQTSEGDGGCTDDTWTATAGPPDGRYNHPAVWTGTEIITWGGGAFGMNTGGRYNPITDTWTNTSTTNAPSARTNHTAVWTGTEMIVWGGNSGTNTGGRYNPGTDSWTATSTTNAPTARVGHVAVWTGTEMIVWGGWDGIPPSFDTGGRYNPNTDTWTATSTTTAPTGRRDFTATWTGSEMIVWGGATDYTGLNTGARYNPVTNSWLTTSTTNAPAARWAHTAVWTGSEMIVWGGTVGCCDYFNTGGKYDPGTDTWVATSTTGAPDARVLHTALWTGTEMIVWGGANVTIGNFNFNTGGRYNPDMDSWTATSTTSAPEGRNSHTAVWTGTEMIVWGGYHGPFPSLNSGGRYNPSTDNWISIGNSNVPDSRKDHTAIWTGSEMIIWGGVGCTQGPNCFLNTGARYIPGIDSWTATTTANAPSARSSHTAVWTGSEMIIWGGGLNTGGRYNPGLDSWTSTSTTNAPSARSSHTAVWTSSEMVVWGGVEGNVQLDTRGRDNASPASPPTPTPTPTPLPPLNTGARYNPDTDSWLATSTTNAPAGRASHTAVWTGSEMIVWGGTGCNLDCFLSTGGRYNPGSDSWTPTSTTNAPSARYLHTAVWTGTEMIVWGGGGYPGTNTGGRFNPDTDSWTPTSTTNAPDARFYHTTVWTGNEMIIWGGTGQFVLNTGGRYDPSTDAWIFTTTANAPFDRFSHSAVWTGTEMIVWGGLIDFGNAVASSGGRYCAESGPTPTPTATPRVTPRPRPTPHPRP
jgi:N-acetylneuraminic acid mutarotase